LKLNPLLLATEAPPIPEAKAWAESYDGSSGPPIDLSQAVPGYPPHAELLARLGAAAAGPGAASYGPILGDAELRSAYAEHVSGLYGAAIAPAHVAITAGCNQAFLVAAMALAKAGDAVILPSPWYFNHKMALDMLGIETLVLPARPDNGFVPDPQEARRLIGGRVRAIVLVTPNNPTGAIYPPDIVAAFHRLCRERGIALILDETYRDFIDAERPPHECLAERGWEETLIQLYSFSKSYCIPGHRTGAMVAAPKIIGEVAKILDTLQICAPRPAQMVLPWAIPGLADWRAANRMEIMARAAAFKRAIAALDGWGTGSIGAYFAYVAPAGAEAGGAEAGGAELCARLARERGVLMLPGSYFGPGQETYLRAAFANVGAAEIAELPARLAGSAANRRRADTPHPSHRHART
jgi:aspartate/methionine/tyrosine aminotransferase